MNIEAVKKIVKEMVDGVDNHTVFSELYFKRYANQICHIFPKTEDNPNGYNQGEK